MNKETNNEEKKSTEDAEKESILEVLYKIKQGYNTPFPSDEALVALVDDLVNVHYINVYGLIHICNSNQKIAVEVLKIPLGVVQTIAMLCAYSRPVECFSKQRRKINQFRVPDEIIGKVIEFMSSKRDLINFMRCSKSIYNFICEENPKCAQNILFVIKRTPVGVAKSLDFVHSVTIDMNRKIKRRKKDEERKRIKQNKLPFYKFNFIILLFFPNLTQLAVYFSNKLDDTILSREQFKKKLERLSLRRCPNVKGTCFKHLHKLKCLEVSGNNKITDDPFNNLKELEVLSVDNCTNFNGSCLYTLPNLKILKLKKIPLISMAKFSSCNKLQMLEVYKCGSRADVDTQECNLITVENLRKKCIKDKIKYLLWKKESVFIFDDKWEGYKEAPYELFEPIKPGYRTQSMY